MVIIRRIIALYILNARSNRTYYHINIRLSNLLFSKIDSISYIFLKLIKNLQLVTQNTLL